jgi:hypothetical protein
VLSRRPFILFVLSASRVVCRRRVDGVLTVYVRRVESVPMRTRRLDAVD